MLPRDGVHKLDGSAGLVFAGQQLKELIGAHRPEFAGTPVGDDSGAHVLVGQLPGVVDQFAGSAPLTDAIG